MSLRFSPDWVVSPGEILREWMEENHVSVRVTATACGHMDPGRLAGILDGKRKLTSIDAAKLAAGTGISARIWIKLEERFRHGLAEGKQWNA